MKILNSALDGKKFLVGDSLSIADISVAVKLMALFQTVLDAGFRKAMGNVTKWAESIYSHASVVKVFG